MFAIQVSDSSKLFVVCNFFQILMTLLFIDFPHLIKFLKLFTIGIVIIPPEEQIVYKEINNNNNNNSTINNLDQVSQLYLAETFDLSIKSIENLKEYSEIINDEDYISVN